MRRHQTTGNDLLVPAQNAKKADEPHLIRFTDILCNKRVGEVLNHHYRKRGRQRH